MDFSAGNYQSVLAHLPDRPEETVFSALFALGLGHRVYLRSSNTELAARLAAAGFSELTDRLVVVSEWSEALAQVNLGHTVVTSPRDELTGLASRLGCPLLPLPKMPDRWSVSHRRAVRVALVGPESSGKTTLAQTLAGEFGLVLAREYVRDLLDFRGSVTTDFQDIRLIMTAQAALEQACALGASKGVICDGICEQTLVWSDLLFSRRPDETAVPPRSYPYDMVLLTKADLSWVADPQRCQPSGGDEFFRRMQAELVSRALPFEVVSGVGDHRVSTARQLLESVLT